MHILLTGSPGTGKSTLIRRVIQQLAIKPCGFQTVSTHFQPDGSSEVYIVPAFAADAEFSPSNLVGHRTADHLWTAHAENFDQAGCQILSAIQDPLIIMDELGFMESKAFQFQKRVIELLHGSIPVLGVIKPRSHPFLDQIRALPQIKILPITIENREQQYQNLLSALHGANSLKISSTFSK